MNIQNLFKKKHPPLKTFTPIVPSGLVAKTEKGYFYIKGNKRFKFVSERAMQTWNLPVVQTVEVKLSGIQVNGVLGLRDGTLAKDISDGKIYLISDSKRRHITNPDVLMWMNTGIIEVSQKEILTHLEGEPLID